MKRALLSRFSPSLLVLLVVLLGSSGVVRSQSSVAIGSGGAAASGPPGPRLVEYLAHPRDFVRIVEGAPFVVPEGRIFVATQVGIVDPTSSVAVARLLVDGALVLECGVDHTAPHATLAPGIAATAGQTVEALATSINRTGSVLGYLADA